MLSTALAGSVVAHSGEPLAAGDLWSAWNLHPLTVLGLVVAAGAYHRGRRRRVRPSAEAWRGRCFAAGLGAVAVALPSPLDALSASLASAHMVQHVLLVLVAAPLLARAVPLRPMISGAPPALRRLATG